MKKQDQIYIPLIIILSIIIPLAVAALMFMPEDWHFKFGGADLRSLPFFHAIINGSTAVLLFTGFVLIKKENQLASYLHAVSFCFIINILNFLCYF